ncbi:hypothetical protein [Sphingomonas phyllosphaerae]|uniref:hypothetical protein n=1 Tax=Sphingomonas phyllosphaerae TaxID=257003 RepID=UPI00241375E6|nr:hypothetical protein [Sphingomonas phyllosphaerae]
MARTRFYIPDEVRQDIRERLTRRVDKTTEEFDSFDEDEDVATGHLGANLTTTGRQVSVPEGDPPGIWSWSLRYHKFRGRGPRATEKILGADGVFELIVDRGGWKSEKSMLFQSKMEGSSGARELVEQCAKLSTWREASAVFSYGEAGFTGMAIDEVLAAKGNLAVAKGAPLGEFLSDVFVECFIGDADLKYHSREKTLSWIDQMGERISTRFKVRHKFTLSVKHPAAVSTALMGSHEISADEIAQHRMKVSELDVLGVAFNASAQERRKEKKRLAKIYHPDSWSDFSESIKKTMEERAKEILSVKIARD